MPSTKTICDTAADYAAARSAIPALAEKTAALVAGIQDPEARSWLAPWTVGEVAVHLANVYLMHVSTTTDEFGDWVDDIADRDDLRGRLADLNDTMLDLITPEELPKVPDMMIERAHALLVATEDRDPDEMCSSPWFGEGDQVTLSTIIGLFLSESLLHGVDIARGSNQEWHVDPELARLAVSLVFPPMMIKTINPAVARGLTADLRFHVRGGPTIGVKLTDGDLTVTRDPADGEGRPDCHLSLDPVAFLLTTSQRVGRARQIALGRMVAYGRKPQLALKAMNLFIYP